MIRSVIIFLGSAMFASQCTSATKVERPNFVFAHQMTGVISAIPFSAKTMYYDSRSINSQPYEILWPIDDQNFLVKQNNSSQKIVLINTSGGVAKSRTFYNSARGIRDFCSFRDSVYILHDKVIICRLLNGNTFTYLRLPPGCQGSKIRYEHGSLSLYGYGKVLTFKNAEFSSKISNTDMKRKEFHINSDVDINSNAAILDWRRGGTEVHARFGFDEDQINLLSFKAYKIKSRLLFAHFRVEKILDSTKSQIKDYLLRKHVSFYDSLKLNDSIAIDMIDVSDFPEKSTAYQLTERIIYANGSIYIVTGDDKHLFIRKMSNVLPSYATRIANLHFERLILHNEKLDGPVDFKYRLMSIISRYKKKYRLYDIKTFLSYIPDSINSVNPENDARRLFIRKNLRSLIRNYQPYDEKINREDDKGVLFTALKFVQSVWSFDSTYIKPLACLTGNPEVKWWLPSDLKNKRHKSLVRGIPYCWGGKKVIEDMHGNGFIKDIRNKLAPGNVFTGARDFCVSIHTTGIDCSGLVVNSFKLNEGLKGKDEIQGTINLAKTDRFNKIGNRISQLKRGDILLKSGKHVAICFDITDHEIVFIHSSLQTWGHLADGLKQGCKIDMVSKPKLSKILDQGYFIYRLDTRKYSYDPYIKTLNECLQLSRVTAN